MTQEEFESRIAEFDNSEPMRSQLYGMGLRLIGSEYEIEAYLLILATWNFARFRYVTRTFDLNRFRETITAIGPIFQRLSNASIEGADLNRLGSDIKAIYSQLKPLVQQTGASKIMHFKQPKLFIMWDTDIRTYYHIPAAASADDYLSFLTLMKTTFGHLQWNRNDKTFAKAIDEYNFLLVHGDEDNP
jgi:hypothetical protein